MSGALNGYRHGALMPGAHAGFAAREDTATIANEATEVIYILPVDDPFFFGAIQTYFAAWLKPATPAATARATPAHGAPVAIAVSVSVAALRRAATAALMRSGFSTISLRIFLILSHINLQK